MPTLILDLATCGKCGSANTDERSRLCNDCGLRSVVRNSDEKIVEDDDVVEEQMEKEAEDRDRVSELERDWNN